MLPMENAAQMNAYIHARSTQTKCIGGEHPRATQSNETNRPCAICPNENVGANIHAQFSQAKCVGAVPVCPPERPRSGVSIPKIGLCITHCARGDERWMRPCGATRAGTQAPPLPIFIIFCHATPYKQNNHLHAIHPNEINHPHVIQPNETVGAVPVCPSERPHSGVSIPKNTRIVRGILTMDAPLWGDTGGHTGTAPTHLRYTFTHRGRKCIAHSRPHNSK